MEQVIESLDKIVSKIRVSKGISIDDYIALRTESQEVLGKNQWWADKSEYVRANHETINDFIKLNDELILERIVADFNQAHRKFEDEYCSCDSKTIEERRKHLDELAENYCAIGFVEPIENCSPKKSKTKHDFGIKRYVSDFKKRIGINGDFEKIKEIYENFKEEGNANGLRNLARKKLIGGSRLNLTNIINAYRKVCYQEGVVEAQRLQEEIIDYANGNAPIQEGEVQTNQEDIMSNKGYFCMSSYMNSMGFGPSNETYKVYEILTGRTDAKNWHERLKILRHAVDSFKPAAGSDNYKYFESVKEGIKESVLRGDLRPMTADSRYKIAVSETLNSLNHYLSESERLIKKVSGQNNAVVEQRLALAF